MKSMQNLKQRQKQVNKAQDPLYGLIAVQGFFVA